MKTTAKIFLTLLAMASSSLSHALPTVKDHVEAELVAEVRSVQPGVPFWVALRLKMDPGWHTYYKEPGDSGIPTAIRWTLPQGFKAGEIQWPQPRTIEMPPLVNYGYEGEVFLLTEITPPKNLKLGTSVPLKARADWLVCRETCIPGRADMELILPVKNETPVLDPRWSESFVNTRALITDMVPGREVGQAPLSVGLALVFSFLGGLILNLMPCVLPVLSIKVLGFLNQAEETHSRPWKHGALFALGVLVSFWVLAGIMLAIRAGGNQLGWGFQLQSPWFVGALAVLFVVFGLNLMGLFEIGTSLMTLGGSWNSRYSGHFASGVLAAVVATPCTAPFMGSALGFAMTQPSGVALSIFTSLGLGMALPYVVLASFPGLLRFVPKPGPWMVRLKQFLGILLLATAVWLFWVLSLQLKTGPSFSPERVQTLREQGTPVFIDFTAAWCLSCQVNERVVLNKPEVQKKFEELGVVTLKADWTNHNETITQALALYGRNSVPFYVLYGRNPKSPPQILPALLTPGIVLDALEKIGPSPTAAPAASATAP